MLQILTLNTWKCDGEYEKRMEIILSQLKKLNYAIIALQECFATTDYSYHTAKWLANELNMDFFFYPTRRKERMMKNMMYDSFSGLAILSKIPMVSKYVIDLPSCPEDPERVAIAIIVRVNRTDVTIVNLHLTYLQKAGKLRNDQFKTLLTNPFIIDKRGIKVYCGDFNCELGSYEMAEFFGPPFNLKDTYKLGGGTEPCLTCPVSEDIPDERRRKIDYILIAPVNSAYPKIWDPKIELNTKDEVYQIYPSDHFGVSCTIDV
jgi:endonuclease/exonuclease/phosphatase family metal-dependent hydrolase